MKNLSTCIKTTPITKPITVGASWFVMEHIYRDNGETRALIVFPQPGRPEGSHRLAPPKFLRENERIEIFEGVFITLKDLSKRSRIVVSIEADKRIPIFSGFPYQWKEAL